MSPARINTASDSVNEIATVRIELRHTDPLIWRQVEVPTSIALKVLHDIIQAVMGWFDYHLWEFTIGKQKYGLPMDEDWGSRQRLMAGKVRLRDVLQRRKTVFDYTYDFGDQWEHRLAVTDVRAGELGVAYPRYIGGERNGPPERIAAAFQASTNGLKRLQTRPTRAMLKPKSGRMNTSQTQSMSCRSNIPSAASRTGATLPRPVSPTRNSSVPSKPFNQYNG